MIPFEEILALHPSIYPPFSMCYLSTFYAEKNVQNYAHLMLMGMWVIFLK